MVQFTGEAELGHPYWWDAAPPRSAEDPLPDRCDILVIGAGAAGMVAALSAADAGAEVLVIEADPAPARSTALSAGLIPAAGTSFQAAAGIEDAPALFAAAIQAKAKGENHPALVDTFATGAAPAIEWLAARYGLPFSVITDFDYPGHARRRMHGLPTRAGLGRDADARRFLAARRLHEPRGLGHEGSAGVRRGPPPHHAP